MLKGYNLRSLFPYILFIISLALFVFKEGEYKGVPFWISVNFIILGFLTIWFTLQREKAKYEQSKIVYLSDSNKIKNTIKKYLNSKDIVNISYTGTLHNELLTPIFNYFDDRIHTEKNIDFFLVCSSSDSYQGLNKQLKEKIFSYESKYPDNIYSHKYSLEHQLLGSILFRCYNGKEIKILFFPIVREGYIGYHKINGLLILNNSFSISHSTINDMSIKMSIEEDQYKMINDVSNFIDSLTQPIKQGYFEKFIPPFAEVEDLKEKWRAVILNHFQLRASKLIQSNDFEEVYISWNLTSESKKDKSSFERWLKVLYQHSQKNQGSTIKVHRFILVDLAKYGDIEDNHYKQMVDELTKEFEKEFHISNSFNVYYVDSTGLDTKLKGDYALFKAKNDENSEVQLTYKQGKSIAEDEVLKIYFSKSCDLREMVKKRFSSLQNQGVQLDDKSIKSFQDYYKYIIPNGLE